MPVTPISMDQLRQRLPQTTLVSIAHRPAVAAFHERQISVDPAAQRVLSEEVARV